jgi:hypothetical protein
MTHSTSHSTLLRRADQRRVFSFRALAAAAAAASSLAFAPAAQAQTNVGTTAAPFLTLGVGARAAAMGGAFVAVADDASALFWNPAGVAELERAQLLFQHASWLAGIDFEYAAVVVPGVAGGNAGASLTLLDSGRMEVTTLLEQEGTGEHFTPRDLALALSYATSLTDRFSLGGQLKYIHQSIWHESADGWAVDLGTLYRTPWRNLTIGTSISNFGTRLQMNGLDLLTNKDLDTSIDGNNANTPANLEVNSWNLPLTFRAGIAVDLLQSSVLPVRAAIDAIHPNDNLESLNLGLEAALSEILALRIGWNHLRPRNLAERLGFDLERDDTVEGGLTAGAGINWEIRGFGLLRIDYAWADYGRLDTTQFFTLGLEF